MYSDGCVRPTICYKADQIDQTVYEKVMNEQHGGKMSGVYESANSSFGVDFTKDSNGYYPKKVRNAFTKNMQFTIEMVAMKFTKIVVINICLKIIIHVEKQKGKDAQFVILSSHLKIALSSRKKTICMKWKMKKCYVIM